jgi:hypothetical protein
MKKIIALILLSFSLQSQTLIKYKQMENPVTTTSLGVWSLSGNTPATHTNFIGTTNNTSLLFKTNNTQRFKIDSLGITQTFSTSSTNSTIAGTSWYANANGTVAASGFNYFQPSNTFTEKIATFRNQHTGIQIYLSHNPQISSISGRLQPLRNNGIALVDSAGNNGIRVDPGGRAVIGASSGTNAANLLVVGSTSISGTGTLNAVITNTSSTLGGQTSLTTFSASSTGTTTGLVNNGTFSTSTTSTLNGNTVINGSITANTDIAFLTNQAFDPGRTARIYYNSTNGFDFIGKTGGASDMGFFTPAGTGLFKNPTGTNHVVLSESGFVRIGSNVAPSVACDVVGAIRCTTTFSAGTTATVTGNFLGAANIASSSKTAGVGYAVGSGSTVTQATSRTTSVVCNSATGQITLFSAAGQTTYQSFTVSCTAVAANDVVIVNQKSGTDLNLIAVTQVNAGSFRISFATTGGTTTEQPVFSYAVIKGQSN